MRPRRPHGRAETALHGDGSSESEGSGGKNGRGLIRGVVATDRGSGRATPVDCPCGRARSPWDIGSRRGVVTISFGCHGWHLQGSRRVGIERSPRLAERSQWLKRKTGEESTRQQKALSIKKRAATLVSQRRLRINCFTTQSSRSDEIEGCFLKAISVADRQQAKWFELRAATSLARLWDRQGKKEKLARR
jgi:hypothetical protein